MMRPDLSQIAASDCWQTPPHIWEFVREMDDGGGIYDPCPAEPKICALTYEWPQDLILYCNPPHGRAHLSHWAARIAEQAARGREILALLPASTGARWWRDHVWDAASALCFLRGRLKFIDPATGSPAKGSGRFWSAMVYYGERADRFFGVFDGAGELARLGVKR